MGFTAARTSTARPNDSETRARRATNEKCRGWTWSTETESVYEAAEYTGAAGTGEAVAEPESGELSDCGGGGIREGRYTDSAGEFVGAVDGEGEVEEGTYAAECKGG
jgi:hypothetical protein